MAVGFRAFPGLKIETWGTQDFQAARNRVMQNRRTIRDRKPSEDGFMLLVAIFFLALLVLSLSIAVPEITKQIRRDREV